MFPEIALSMAAGVAFGTLTGLVPGIHPNTVFAVLLSAAFLAESVPPVPLLVFVVSVAVSNTFTDFLPSVLFGAPDPSTALSVLPGHRMLLDGLGQEAVGLTIIGGLGVSFLTILTLPLLVFLAPAAYSLIRPHLHVILILVVAWMALSEPGARKALSILGFALSGLLGVVTLGAHPGDSLLFPSLTGLFALSTLTTSYRARTTIPEQDLSGEIPGDHRKGILTGWLAGWLAGMLPGVGASQAGVLAAQTSGARRGEFLTALGGINTSNILFTLVLLFVLGKTRSGAAAAMSALGAALTPWTMLLLAIAGITVAMASSAITLALSRGMLSRMRNVSYSRLTLAVMASLIATVALLSGPLGLLAALTGTLIGLLVILTGVRRSHMMGYLMLPTILYFSGLAPHLMLTLGL